MTTLFLIIIANFLISLASLVGVFTLSLKEKVFEKILLFLVSLSAGALMGGAFLHLIPEAYEKIKDESVFFYVLLGFIFFFIVEKIFHWRHCHKEKCDIHTFGYLNLIGDSLHNFIDGLIIAGTFLTDIRLGIVTSFLIASHEIPQELGDFGVLLYAGFSRKKALFLNFLIATAAILGGLFSFFLSFYQESLIKFLLPLAAGGFIYVSASDLMPEIKKETNLKKSMVSFGVFILGILITLLAKEV